MWISKTPLRASFLGGGTDYPAYFRKYPGAVLGGTIDKFIYIQALPLAGIAEQRFRVTYRTTESVDDVEEIKHPVIRESLKHYEWDRPLNIATMSDLPGSTGLGSSSAFTVGFINLLHQMRGVELTRYELARQAIYMEQTILNEQVGIQDQVHAAFGGLARYEFAGETISIEPLRVTTSRLSLLNSSMLLVYTGGQRSASAVLASQETRTKSGANETYLREMYEMTRIGGGILEASGEDVAALKRFGELLDHGWNLKRQLGNTVSNSAIDDIYLTGKEMGAWGGKLLGAGGGGFVLFLADNDVQQAIIERFGRDNVVSIMMTPYGSTVSNH
ncbi:galactokinase [Martelella lutilitoris]|uniref:Galactokinase n=1 Tax=Martelella lutilitoris TaxID=2583532 RepID=A0A7T7HLE5_9HYPH|nr:galactokinase [Martelella lutilitoris]QQM31257.1 galactokinase [Martelella lutilitoris]